MTAPDERSSAGLDGVPGLGQVFAYALLAIIAATAAIAYLLRSEERPDNLQLNEWRPTNTIVAAAAQRVSATSSAETATLPPTASAASTVASFAATSATATESPTGKTKMPDALATPTATVIPTAHATPSTTATATAAPSATATATTTAQPTATATATMTATTEPSPTPTVSLSQRVLDAEAALQSGRLDAVLDYGDGTLATASVTFDLGSAERAARLHIVSTYAGTGTTRKVERITIGAQTWQREQDGSWAGVTVPESVSGQLRSFLPGVSAAGPITEDIGESTTLSWYDDAREDEVTLTVDELTGVPQQLRRASRSDTTVLTVRYSSWNVPVEITPPATE